MSFPRCWRRDEEKNKGLLYHRKDKVNKHARGYHAEEGSSVETVNCRACARNQGSRRLALRVAAPTEGPAKTTREVGSDITWRRRQSAIENAPKHRNDGKDGKALNHGRDMLCV